MDTLKAEQIDSAKWRVLAIPFGGPFKGKDWDGEYFDAETDIRPRWFKERPVLFHHGQDPNLPLTKGDDGAELGVEDDLTMSPEGWWATTWLNRSHRYWAQVDSMLRAGKMYGSSGAIAHLVRKDRKSGHIEVWPHAEQTYTPTPANPYAIITASKALVADLDAIPADLRTYLSQDGETAAMLERAGQELARIRADLRRI